MSATESKSASTTTNLIETTADVVTAYGANNSVVRENLPSLIESVYAAFSKIHLGGQTEKAREPLAPRMPIKKTITPDFLISLEDGRQYRTLKRHLRGLGLTPQEYRAKWDLPADYPMVAPNYSKQRSEMAKSMGLGAPQKKAKKTGSRRAAAA
ncbi:MucR family transcriptional regulator [Microvirga sp. TS319]|uniref:MucR family transcriptional regulator n=1 Tax=Microvirga sp. TS319 TaxID=3241165 RepID=UPI00351A2129